MTALRAALSPETEHTHHLKEEFENVNDLSGHKTNVQIVYSMVNVQLLIIQESSFHKTLNCLGVLFKNSFFFYYV